MSFAGIVASSTVTSRVVQRACTGDGGSNRRDLLHCVRDQREVVRQLGALVGIRVEHAGRPAEVPRHRLASGAEEQDAEVGELRVGELADLAVLVGDFGLDEVGEDVVVRVRPPVGEVLAEMLAEAHERIHGDVVRHSDVFFHVEDVVDEAAHLWLLTFGHSEERGDDEWRQDGREVLHVVEPAGPDLGVEQSGADLAECGPRASTPGGS